MITEQITQRQAISNGVSPQILNSGATARASTYGVDMTKSYRAFFTLYVGNVTAGNISAWLQESSDNFQTDIPSNDAASPFSGSGGTNLSLTGLTTSNQIYTFEVMANQLSPGKKFVRLQVKNTAASDTQVCVIAIGEDANHKPNKVNNGTAVNTQQVVS